MVDRLPSTDGASPLSFQKSLMPSLHSAIYGRAGYSARRTNCGPPL